MTGRLFALLAVLILAGCTSVAGPANAPTSKPPASNAPVSAARVRPSHTPAPVNPPGVLPDAVQTPGAVNPAVRPGTIAATICVVGWTKTVRPPPNYTTALKIHQLQTGYTYHGDTDTRDYEEDHLIPLELGGSPRSVDNLWPEPYDAAFGARTKDLLENTLHRLVCAGLIGLRVAQRAIARNWVTAYRKYVTP
jgi:hypothetical protein